VEETSENLLSLPATASRLRHIAAGMCLNAIAFQRAFALSGLYPDRGKWSQTLNRLLIFMGTALVVAGIALFFAYNWPDLHKFHKFALIEAGIVATVAAAWRLGLDSLAGRAALFAAAFLTGTLLAVYGQTYQTGADSYGLFLAWLALIAGWALIGRQPGLWMLAALLSNLALILYWGEIMHPSSATWDWLARLFGPLIWLTYVVTDFSLAQWVFSLNASLLVVWEFFTARQVLWMVGRWLPRLLALFALTPIAIATLMMIFSSGLLPGHWRQSASPVLFTVFTVAALWYYRYRQRDLFILAVSLLGAMVVLTALIARGMTRPGFDAFLLLALLIVGQTAGAAMWLRQVARSWRTIS